MSYNLINASKNGNTIKIINIKLESGVSKIFDILPFKVYVIKFDEFRKENSNQKIKILNNENKILANTFLNNSNKYIFRNDI